MTTPAQKYSAPPIIEAIVQLVFVDELSSAQVRKLLPKLSRGYDHSVDQENINVNVDFVNRNADFTSQAQKRLSSYDEADALLVLNNALSWVRLAPYLGWDNFIGRVKRDLEILIDVVGLRKLSRIGVRYVNRLDIPMISGRAEYEDFFAINLGLPPEIDPIQNFAWRFEREFPDQHLLAVVQSATVQPELPGTMGFLLDIDIVASHELPLKREDLLRKLVSMRELKNRIFEISVTDKARESFST